VVLFGVLYSSASSRWCYFPFCGMRDWLFYLFSEFQFQGFSAVFTRTPSSRGHTSFRCINLSIRVGAYYIPPQKKRGIWIYPSFERR